MPLAGKVALVTGGGSGIGRATAQQFGAGGARVAVVDMALDRAHETAAAIQQSGGDAIAIQTDVARSDAAADMVRQVVDRWGRIDVLHNNAGISMSGSLVEDLDDGLFDRIMATNVRSVFLGAKYVVPHMKRQRSGVIITTASTAGIRPREGASAYAASKGAVIALTKAFAVELAPFGIRAVCVAPFATDTPMLRAQMDLESPQHASQSRIGMIPLGRLIAPEEVAQAIVYLASDAASMITGTVLEIDGGRLLR
jgi:3-oxoacyl-[acyl-carrier protein] reductase